MKIKSIVAKDYMVRVYGGDANFRYFSTFEQNLSVDWIAQRFAAEVSRLVPDAEVEVKVVARPTFIPRWLFRLWYVVKDRTR